MNNIIKFENLHLSPEILKSIAEMGYKQTTPIQGQAIPFIVDGRDVTGLAMTGTGKTAAFSLPLIDKIDARRKEVQALIICPTRELAIQVSGEIRKFLKLSRNEYKWKDTICLYTLNIHYLLSQFQKSQTRHDYFQQLATNNEYPIE